MAKPQSAANFGSATSPLPSYRAIGTLTTCSPWLTRKAKNGRGRWNHLDPHAAVLNDDTRPEMCSDNHGAGQTRNRQFGGQGLPLCNRRLSGCTPRDVTNTYGS
jgi:hypothetical protein